MKIQDVIKEREAMLYKVLSKHGEHIQNCIVHISWLQGQIEKRKKMQKILTRCGAGVAVLNVLFLFLILVR